MVYWSPSTQGCLFSNRFVNRELNVTLLITAYNTKKLHEWNWLKDSTMLIQWQYCRYTINSTNIKNKTSFLALVSKFSIKSLRLPSSHTSMVSTGWWKSLKQGYLSLVLSYTQCLLVFSQISDWHQLSLPPTDLCLPSLWSRDDWHEGLPLAQ